MSESGAEGRSETSHSRTSSARWQVALRTKSRDNLARRAAPLDSFTATGGAEPTRAHPWTGTRRRCTGSSAGRRPPSCGRSSGPPPAAGSSTGTACGTETGCGSGRGRRLAAPWFSYRKAQGGPRGRGGLDSSSVQIQTLHGHQPEAEWLGNN